MKIEANFNINYRRILMLVGVGIMLVALAMFAVDISRQENLNHYPGHPLGGDYMQFWACARLVVLHIAEGAYQMEWLTRMIATVNLSYADHTHGISVLNNPLYYPPVYLLYLAPFGYLPYFASFLTFFVSTAALYFVGLGQLCRGQRWLLVLMLGFAGVWLNLVSGQNGLLTAGLLALGLAWLPRHATVAGIFFGLMCFKPHLGMLIPFALLAGREWRAFFFAAVTVIGLVFYSLAVFGPDVWFLSTIGSQFAVKVLAEAAYLWKRMPTLYALLRLQGFDFSVALIAQILLGMLTSVAVMWVWAKSRNSRLRGMALAAGVLLATPFAYDYDYAILGICFVLLVQEGLAGEKGPLWYPLERLGLALAFVWPVLINRIGGLTYGLTGIYSQVGFVMPLFLLLFAMRRVQAAAKVAEKPAATLEQAA